MCLSIQHNTALWQIRMVQPAISVIIPVYNVASWLRECLDSVLSQTFEDLEIIIVDDGSTDSSPEIIAEYAAKDRRIIAIRKENGGLGVARNTALAMAKGEYIAFLDSDDKIHINAFAKLYDKAKQHDCDIVFCQTAYLDDITGNISEENNQTALPLFEQFKGKVDFFTLDQIDPVMIFSYDSFVVTWNKIIKRSLIENINASFPEGLIFEDMPFYFNTLLNAHNLAVVWERLIYYRINRKNSIMSSREREGDIVEILLTIADDLIKTKGRTGRDYQDVMSPFAYQELGYKFNYIDKSKLTRDILDRLLVTDDRKRFERDWLKKKSLLSQLKRKLFKRKLN